LVGLDPIEQRNAERASRTVAEAKAMTFDECRDAYIASHETGWRNAAHRQQWSSTLATYASPAFGRLPVDAVDTGLVLQVLEPIWTDKNETASRVRGRIEAILDWARVRGYRNGPNPAMWKGHLDHLLLVKSKVAKIEHHPALPYARVGEFMADLFKRDGVAVRALRFTVLTAARAGEVFGMPWGEVDLTAKLWTIPGDRMKGGRQHRVSLSEQALSILSEGDRRCGPRRGTPIPPAVRVPRQQARPAALQYGDAGTDPSYELRARGCRTSSSQYESRGLFAVASSASAPRKAEPTVATSNRP
jgi:integrase